MVNKRIICLLCMTVILTGIFTVCNKVNANPYATAQLTSTKDQKTPTQAGTYWKTVGFDGIEIKAGDFWSDLFLWEDGTGYFRFSEATPANLYYGKHDVMKCDWSMKENGSITLFSPGTKDVLYSGLVTNDVLTINYDSYTPKTIKMEQSKMPPYGSHWTILDLYGTWRMLSYTDSVSGYRTVPYYTVGGTDGFFASEITFDRLSGVHFWLADPLISRVEIVRNKGIGYHDDNDYTWHPYIMEPIWDGCVNEAWHVELTGNSNPNIRFYVTYANDKLLLKKVDLNNPSHFPSSFTAEFKYVGYTADLGEGDAKDIVNKRYAEMAYSVVLYLYRNVLQIGGNSEEIADRLVYFLNDKSYTYMGLDERALNNVYSSFEEPLRSKSNFGYAIRDINEDGIPELFILSKDDYSDDYTINSIFTLHNGSTILVGAYWSRNQCMLAKDGTIYINGSSGADETLSASFSLSPQTGKLQLIERFKAPYSPNITTKEAGLLFTPLLKDSERRR